MPDLNLLFGMNADRIGQDRLVGFFKELESSAPAALAGHHQDRSGFQSRLRDDYGVGFDLMDLQYASAWEAADWAKRTIDDAYDSTDEEFLSYYHVISGLTARCLGSYAEVAWLLRGGFPNGAMTRVRTLHELLVTALILAKFASPGSDHPELIQRYLLHKDVFTLSTAENLSETGAIEPTTLDEKTLDLLASQREKLLTKYGRSFGGLWGWAAPLFGAGVRISMKSLSQLVTPGTHYFYGLTSTHVHGGSEGWHENFVTRGHETVLAAGPSNMGLALPATLASAFLTDMMQTAVPAVIENETSCDYRGEYFLAGIHHQAGQISTEMWQAEAVVERRENKYQAHEQPES